MDTVCQMCVLKAWAKNDDHECMNFKLIPNAGCAKQIPHFKETNRCDSLSSMRVTFCSMSLKCNETMVIQNRVGKNCDICVSGMLPSQQLCCGGRDSYNILPSRDLPTASLAGLQV